MLNDAVNRSAAQGMSDDELYDEIVMAGKAREAILPQYNKAVVWSRLYEILAGTLDDLSDYLGALESEQDSR